MKKASLLALSVAITMSIIGCNPKSVLIGNGVIITDSITNPSPFTKIQVSGIYAIILEPSPNYSVVIEGDENIIQQIEKSISDNTLFVNTDQNSRVDIQSKTELTIRISAPSFQQITTKGFGTVSSLNPIVNTENLEINNSGASLVTLVVNANSLTLNNSGVGNMQIEGKTNKLQVAQSGAGNMDLSNLISNSCNIDVSGVGNAAVFVTDEIKATISGVGNITVTGNPKTKSDKISGMGKVTYE